MAVIKSLRWAVLGVVSLGALVCGAAAIRAVEVPTSESMQLATTPDDRLDQDWWKKRHEEKLALAKEGGWDVAFIGDSITHGWEGHGKETWAEFYGDRKAINLGYSGDRTEHVLWRLDHGELAVLTRGHEIVLETTAVRVDLGVGLRDDVVLFLKGRVVLDRHGRRSVGDRARTDEHRYRSAARRHVRCGGVAHFL